jgi:4-amino-4-deoxy-L-arabinose transferase-like glycosyltransferase
MRWVASGMAALKCVRKDHLPLAAILILGAWVRLSALDLGWFLEDQVRDGMAALDLLRGRDFPLVGPQAAFSTLNLVGPLYYYLLAIPYAISANPVVGIAFSNILNLCSIYLAYRLGSAMFGPPVGLIASALYAVFPMAVLSGKGLWNPGFIPFFSTLLLWTLWRFLTEQHPWMLALVLVLLGVLLQIHLSGAVFVLLLPVALLLYRPPVRLKPLIAGLLGVALLFAPYMRFEIQQGFIDLQKLLGWAERPLATSFWIIASHGFSRPFLLPEKLAIALPGEGYPVILQAAQRVELGLIVLGLLALLVRVITAGDRRPYLLLILWYALPFVIVPLSRVGAMWYYFDILYPAPFLVIALLTQLGPNRVPSGYCIGGDRRRPQLGLAGVVGGLIVVQVAFLSSFEQVVGRSGVFPIVPEVLLQYPNPQWRTEVAWMNMPLRFKMALRGHLLQEFGADHPLLERAAHGGVYQLLREDKGFLSRAVSPSKPPKQADPALHYAVLRDDLRDLVEPGLEVVCKPYRVVAYRPMVRYDAWRWSARPETGWWGTSFDDAPWSRLTLPARSFADPSVYGAIPYMQWPRTSVAFRGWIDAPTPGLAVWLVLNIRAPYASAHTVEALHLNGQPLESTRTSWGNYYSHNFEVQAEITSALRPGANLIAFEIAGTGGSFDLDVYERQLAPRATGKE